MRLSYVHLCATSARLGIDLDDSVIDYGDEDFQGFEHFVHEVAHALSLGLDLRNPEPGTNTPAQIGDVLRNLKGRAKYRNETLVLSSEFYLFTGKLSSLQVRSDWDEILYGLAAEQNCTLIEWERALRNPHARHLSCMILDFLVERRIVRP